MPVRKRVLVNAIPMINVNTGIARYLRCLYQELEHSWENEYAFSYFDGRHISQTMPQGPENLRRWSSLVDLFWKLPAYTALLFRLAVHFKREKIFRKECHDFDLYHEAGFFPFRPKAGVKTIFTIHDLSLFRFPEHHPRERVLFTKLFWKSRYRLVNRFLSVSRFSKSELEECFGVRGKDISVTPLAHEARVFSPRSQERVYSFLQKRELPEHYFLFVGSGDPRKNLPVIPKAIHAAGLSVPLIVAGWSGWSRKGLPAGLFPLGYVTDEELALLYSGALALVFPSTYEGFGLPILEAMACGCPVVTTREASLPEVAGDAALYVHDPSDPEELGRILKALASESEKRQGLRIKGLARAAQFSWEQTARQTAEAFRQVLNHA